MYNLRMKGIAIFLRQVWDFLEVPDSMLFPLLCCFASQCFSAEFPAFCFPCFFAFLLLCFPCCSNFVLLCLSTSTILLDSCIQPWFCCSTSCSFALLLSVFAASLFFMFFGCMLSCLHPKYNPRETLGPS